MTLRFLYFRERNHSHHTVAGFTLVELLVIIAILAILTVVGFLLLGNTTATARDSQRIANIRQLHDATRLQAASLHVLPMPYQAIPISIGGGSGTIDLTISGATSQYAVFVDGSTQLSTLTGSRLLALTRDGGVDSLLAGGTFSGTLSNQNLGWQGYADSSIAGNLNYSDTVDPQDQTLFTYRLGQNRDKSQFLAYLENPEHENQTPLLWKNISDEANAADADYTKRYPYVWGDRLGIVLDKGTNAPVQQGLTPPVNNNTGSTGSGNTIDTSGMMVGVGQGHSCVLKADQSVVCWGDNYDGQTDVPSGLVDVVQISVGYYHSCALQSDGVVACWGYDNEDGRTAVGSFSDVTQISAGGEHTCALKSDGTVECVGADWYGQSTPPSGLTNVVQISAGEYHTCALKSDATVECWGSNDNGQIDIPLGLSNITQVSAGKYHTCALKSDATVECWGINMEGENPAAYVPPGLADVTQISSDSSYNCALKSDGSVECWGEYWNSDGWSVSSNYVPPDLSNVVQISAGREHTCVIKSDSSVVCWNLFGYLPVPEELQNFPVILNSVVFDDHRLTTGNNFTCAITSTGGVECWGANDAGQLDIPIGLDNVIAISAGYRFACTLSSDGIVSCWGDPSGGQTDVPVGLSGVVQMSVGYNNVCALKSDGTVTCWGDNSDGQTNVPSELNHIVQIATGWNFACALKDTGRMQCWGNMGSGQDNFPSDIGTVKQISAGDEHICAIKTDDSVVCWGSNGDLSGASNVAHISAGEYYSCLVHTDGSVECDGDNGDGQADVPMTLSGVTEISTSMGGSHTCALKSDNTIACWGQGMDGQTEVPPGFGGIASSPITEPVFEDQGMTTGYQFTCALKSDATVECWGLNADGQTTVPSGLTNVTQISAGASHTCALKSDGTVECWGLNDDGQTTTPSGLSNVTQISAGASHVCALKSDGTVECWGLNDNGQTTPPSGLTDVVQVVSGDYHSCALRSDRTLTCWGSDSEGQTDVPTLTRVAQLAAGSAYTCALRETGRVFCWGTISGDIGVDNVVKISAGGGNLCTMKADGSVECFTQSTFIHGENMIPSSLSAIDIATSPTHVCARDASNQVICWGSNWEGESDSPVPFGSGFTPLNLASTRYEDQRISAGHAFSCAIKTDETVECWGNNYLGLATPPSGLNDVIQITSGQTHTCALKSDGTIECWGFNYSGENDVPIGLTNVVQISAGDGHTCALKSDNTVECWGSNNYSESSIPDGLNHDIIEVVAGNYTTCVLQTNGKMQCIGGNSLGFRNEVDTIGSTMLGIEICSVQYDTSVMCNSVTPPSPITNAVKVANSNTDACALKSDGTVECWGDNSNGQGNIPSGLSNVIDITVGSYHVCVLKSDNSVVCWGNNDNGQTDIPEDLRPITITSFVHEGANISLGADHTCVLRSGSALCSANNDTIQNNVVQVAAGSMNTCNLRSDSTVDCSLLEVPLGLSSTTAVSVGDNHACALKSDGTVECWGDNEYGKIDVPPGLTGVVSISLGSYHSCALKSDKTVECWGDNRSNQSLVPGDLSGVMEVSAGSNFTCSLIQTGFVRCWGYNGNGQTNIPSGLSDVVSISSGYGHTCALKSDSTMSCWGSNSYGQNNTPSGLSDIAEVSAGGAHTCALKSDSTIVCWGRNDRSQVSFQNLLEIPQGVTGSNVASYDQKRIGVASDHKCAIRSDSTVACWGGDNALGQNNVPGGLSGVIQILVLNGETCAVKSDGQLVCWGFSWSASKPNFPIDSVRQISGFNSVDQGTTMVPKISTLCVVRNDGSVVCWGNNQYGQTNVPSNVTNVKQVSVGAEHVCALKNNGTVQCWGSSGYSQTHVPSGLSGVTQITNTAGRTYARKSDGNVISWGFYSNNSSNTTDISHINALSFVNNNGSIPNTLINNILDIDSAPNFDHHETDIDSTCVLKNDETITCFHPLTGALQDVPGEFQMNLPNVVFNDQNMSSTKQWSPWFSPVYPEVCRINSDQSLTCGYLDDKTLYDMNDDGVLDDDGNGHPVNVPTPISPLDTMLLTPDQFNFAENVPRFCNSHHMETYLSNHINCGINIWADTTPALSGTFHQIQNGQYGGCALSTDGDVQCWGDIAANMPSGLSGILQVAVSESYPASACVIRSDHTVLCWGGSSYGNGTDLSSTFYDIVQITNLHHLCGLKSGGGAICENYNSYASVVPGTSSLTNLVGTHWGTTNDVCAIQQPNSRLVCWQYNVSGSPTVDSSIPAITNVSKFNIGYQHGCVVKNDGTVECWGSNDHGQTAVPIGLSDVTEIAIVGGYQTCALKNNGQTTCWGLPGIIYSDTCPNGSGTCYRFNGIYE